MLLLDRLIHLALGAARGAFSFGAGEELAAGRVLDVKVRAFTNPGQLLELGVQHLQMDSGIWIGKLSARANGKPVATAKVEIVRRGSPA